MRLSRLLLIAFLCLVCRHLWLITVDAPYLASLPYNPRSYHGAQGRGAILARDGTPLAESHGSLRLYPLGSALAQSVGYLSPRYGRTGLESAYDALLSPFPPGESLWERLREVWTRRADARHRRVGSVITTIDPLIETRLAQELAAYPRAAGVVLDPRSGAILALVSQPSYDPALLERAFPTLAHDPQSALLNRAVDGLYPPGSTFKIVTAAAALQAGIATLHTVYEDPGTIAIGGSVIHDDEGEATGEQTLLDAFALSSNVDFARLGVAVGRDRFLALAHAFGVGQSLPLPIEVARDRLPAADRIDDPTLAQLAFGQASLLVTPLRMALITATVANGGVMMAPRLVERTIDGERHEQRNTPSVMAEPIGPATAAALTLAMERVVTNGTGLAAALPDIAVAGKTGTATNPAGAPDAWFVGFAPATAPQVVIAIVVENAGYGGRVAAPIARRVLSTALAQPVRTP